MCMYNEIKLQHLIKLHVMCMYNEIKLQHHKTTCKCMYNEIKLQSNMYVFEM